VLPRIVEAEAIMSVTTPALLRWAPRIAGVAVSLFLALFALDAFDDKSFLAALPGFLVHLFPACLVLGAVAVAWRFPLVGAVAFAGLAVIYGIRVKWRLDWVAVIGGPLLIVAALYAVSARYAGGREPPV
jgi:hypothetical protein